MMPQIVYRGSKILILLLINGLIPAATDNNPELKVCISLDNMYVSHEHKYKPSFDDQLQACFSPKAEGSSSVDP